MGRAKEIGSTVLDQIMRQILILDRVEGTARCTRQPSIKNAEGQDVFIDKSLIQLSLWEYLEFGIRYRFN